jgi:hypothetical protein
LKRREKTIGNYAIIKTIGEGRYGKVKLAEHIVTRKKVAVKIMKKAQMEAADLARIKRELRVMTVLDHPNIVKLYQVIDTPETTCIVMEFCSGGDLYDYISTYRRLSVPNALKLFRQIVAGLLYCHQHLVIHRDVRPFLFCFCFVLFCFRFCFVLSSKARLVVDVLKRGGGVGAVCRSSQRTFSSPKTCR